MRRETREAWGRRVERWKRSGLTAARFAAREGVNAGTLAFWKWKLGRDAGGDRRPDRGDGRGRGDKRVGFVEMVTATALPAPVTDARPAAAFEVVVPGGYRVRIAPGFERAVLAELLDVLEGRR